MKPPNQTYIYTTTGRQRPVFITAPVVRFVLALMPGDSGRVQTSCDPPALVRQGQALWEDYSGGVEGAISQITALRVVLGPISGWAQFVVQQEEKTHGTSH